MRTRYVTLECPRNGELVTCLACPGKHQVAHIVWTRLREGYSRPPKCETHGIDLVVVEDDDQ